MQPSDLARACRDVQALSFDCYGTIIDWDTGISGALSKLEALAGCDLDRLLVDREQLEYELLAADYLPYGEVLGESMRRAAGLQACKVGDQACLDFASSMGHWSAFEDSPAALASLAQRFRLALLSNVETATLEQSIAPLGIEFAQLITAEKVRSYKPDMVHFDTALERLNLDASQILHVAGSLYHDIRPALEAGWRVVWINRRGDPIPSDLDAAWVLPDLASLAERLA